MSKGLEAAFLKARIAEKRGDRDAAGDIYRAILQQFPGNARARTALAKLDTAAAAPSTGPAQAEIDALLILYNSGQMAELAVRAEALAARHPDAAQLLHILGAAQVALKRFADAERSFRRVAALTPGNIEALASLGVALKGQGRFDEAADAYRHLLAIRPDHASTHANLGNLLNDRGRIDEAIEAYRRATDLDPALIEAQLNLGVLLKTQGRLDEAVTVNRRLIALRPDHAMAHANLGNALRELKRVPEAIEAYGRAIALKPDMPEFHMNLGVMLKDEGQNEAAIEAYRKVIAHQPDHVEALNNLGNALQEQGRLDQAADAYREALARKPDYAEALSNLGVLLQDQRKFDPATDALRRAIALKPNYPEAYANLAFTLQQQGKLDLAVEAYDKAVALNPDNHSSLAQSLHQQAHMCDWTAFDRFRAAAPWLGIEGEKVSPFATLAFEDDPARQRRRSELWADQSYKRRAPSLPATATAADGRIRIGYFSADFHNHATMYLMAGLFREHDRARFDIHAYSYGGDQDDAMRRHLIANSSSFTNVRGRSDQAVVDLARGDGLDIAVDLKGYTGDTRTQLFALRPAPVQISYIGYPGTLGADFIDYMVADPVVVPDAERAHYSEKILYLPHCYQPNDDQRVIAARTATRVSAGLPEQGFVFCSFNNNYKISPDAFDIWMRLLSRVEGSVLWLFEANRWSIANLRREAAARGIDPARLVTAGRLPHEEHLARLHLADLFLDSFAYTAHTTASDALWGGLPIVTLAGRQFAARVGASLLNAVGLPELVTDSPAAYEALALDLATHPERLAAIRDKLAANRMTQPLFDTVAYTRHLEAGYEAAVERHRAGLPPEDIRVG